jgi:cell division protein FtsZ
MGIGRARGEDRAAIAAEMAVASPLLEASMEGARGVLINISGGSDLGLFEIHTAAELVTEAASEEANVIFGTVIDDALGDEIRITVIAAGFDGGTPKPRTERPVRRAAPAPVAGAPSAAAPDHIDLTATPVHDALREARGIPPVPPLPPRPAPAPVARPERRTVVFVDQDDDLDVPDFLK